MKYTLLADTDIRISRLAFGAWAIIGGFNWGDQDAKDSIAALQAAYDSGVTLFDTAEGYGNGSSEQLIGKALGSVRDDIVIASKVSAQHLAPAELRTACERSLASLNTDRIDIYQVHWPSRSVPFADTFSELDALKKQGKIRHYGVSNFGKADIAAAVACGAEIKSDQLAYNLLFRAVEYGIAPVCVENGLGILAYSPLMQGLLTGKFQCADDVPSQRARTRHFSGERPDARHGEQGCEKETFDAVEAVRNISTASGIAMRDLAVGWLLAQPGVASAIVGSRDAAQAKANAQSADVELSQDVLEALNIATQPLKEQLGGNADMWEGDSRIQ